ncbi:NAD(P)/FAD-dependent oxidoreductase [Ktedonobacter racemifer]|uniref:NADH:ubiquinone reductase (non-electrogenic) n=1 Tax=Ktedonobacter racemifer DSM 44963 TaxID=485913 RepID=D6TNY9_KTERA|nr:NAD(P)/FAD-dependent oxidoreductase [Ktedonobacter racemifer]EFH85525.1 FAD-dependent pyridine nucleotide-disulfide oxidoreductase [Ktedonobacter racemifer DSM 44963]
MMQKQQSDGFSVTTGLPRVVIVGAGFGGLRVARSLRDAPAQVTVIDKNNHHLFQPLLYQVATAGLSPADISAPIRSILKSQQNTTVLLAEVTGVDTERQLVLTAEREIPYDYLILATGAAHSYFGHDEWSDFAPGLKTITDATHIRRQVLLAFEAAEMEPDPDRQQELMTFVLVGAGPTGVEMSGAIAELAHKALARDFRHIDPRSARVILVEAMPRILPAFPEKLAQKARKALNHLGVEVRTNSPVENIDREGVVVAGQRIPARNVIWTAGVAASPAGKWLQAEVDRAGRVKVQPDLSVPGLPNVFVIGDTSSLMQNGKPLPGVAPVAMQQGNYIGSLIVQKVKGSQASEPAFQYTNKGNLATVGRSFGIADFGRVRIWGFLGWLLWLAVHIFFLIGFRNRVLVIFQWAWAYLTFQRGARLITYPRPSHSQQKELVEELL